jgi:hypothetical protein
VEYTYADARIASVTPNRFSNGRAAMSPALTAMPLMERHEVASDAYEAAGLQILELAQTAYSSYVAKNPREQARLVKTLVSNSTFDRGSLSPTYIKPFDVLANGGE